MMTINEKLVVLSSLFPLLAPAFMLCGNVAALGGEPDHSTSEKLARRIRQPVAMVLAGGGSRLLVANGRSGSISVVDTAVRRVLSEHDVCRGLADLACLPDDRHVLALSSEENAVVLLDRQDMSLRIIMRLQIGPDPVRMLICAMGPCVLSLLAGRAV